MARDQHEREDLMGEAVAYVRRIEFASASGEPTFVGFRDCGAASFYFGHDHVLQFNATGELRRAFWQNQMMASYRKELHWLTRSEGRVRLQRTALNEAELSRFVSESLAEFERFKLHLRTECPRYREFPERGNVVSDVVAWLERHADEVVLAVHPGLAKQNASKK